MYSFYRIDSTSDSNRPFPLTILFLPLDSFEWNKLLFKFILFGRHDMQISFYARWTQ